MFVMEKMYYDSYLQLDKVLTAQQPESFKNEHVPAHDEMLFIIIHQAYELWFKQVLFELDFCHSIFSKDKINDNAEDLNLVRHRLQRVIKIIELLNQQVHILDTMTPLDFLEFRNLLTPSSGFQSVQFRQIEALLGLKIEKRHNSEHYKRTNEGGFTSKDLSTVEATENKQSIQVLLNNWLERMPFFDDSLWAECHLETVEKHSSQAFWNMYAIIYKQSLTEKEANKFHDFLSQIINASNENIEQLFSSKALRAALFIMLYRDFPVFQTSYQILDSFIEIDHLLSNWRHKHLIMVRRMIGMRVGTGNTSGAGYLEGALSKHFVFNEISSLATFLIERNKLPKLPTALIKHLSFYE
jgi:tryptophan 2,3-dioxygenase